MELSFSTLEPGPEPLGYLIDHQLQEQIRRNNQQQNTDSSMEVLERQVQAFGVKRNAGVK